MTFLPKCAIMESMVSLDKNRTPNIVDQTVDLPAALADFDATRGTGNHVTKPERANKKLVAFLAAAAIAPFVAKGFVEGHDYGYHPSRNPAPPTYLETHTGTNPADIVKPQGG